MLKPTLVALTVMGCDCDARICVPLDAEPARFATIEQCEAAVVPTIRNGAAAYPLLTAHCAVLSEEPRSMLAVLDQADEPAGDTGTPALPVAALSGGVTRVGDAGRYLVFRVGDGFVAARGGLARIYDNAVGIALGGAYWVASKAAPR